MGFSTGAELGNLVNSTLDPRLYHQSRPEHGRLAQFLMSHTLRLIAPNLFRVSPVLGIVRFDVRPEDLERAKMLVDGGQYISLSELVVRGVSEMCKALETSIYLEDIFSPVRGESKTVPVYVCDTPRVVQVPAHLLVMYEVDQPPILPSRASARMFARIVDYASRKAS